MKSTLLVSNYNTKLKQISDLVWKTVWAKIKTQSLQEQIKIDIFKEQHTGHVYWQTWTHVMERFYKNNNNICDDILRLYGDETSKKL